MLNEPVSFEISIIGTLTGEKWIGVFKAKPRLSFGDQLRADQVRRDLLGVNTQDATAVARAMAEMFSQLSVRLVETPAWWKEAQNGLSLSDDNVLIEVYNRALAIEREVFDGLKKTAEKAKDELAKKE